MMRIIVTRKPETPIRCLFSEVRTIPNGRSATLCKLRPYVEEAGGTCKPLCVCKDVNSCECLTTFEEADEWQ